MKTGTVKSYNDARGFGAITPDDGSGELYFSGPRYKGNSYGILKEGQKVQFDVESSPKGLAAINVVAL